MNIFCGSLLHHDFAQLLSFSALLSSNSRGQHQQHQQRQRRHDHRVTRLHTASTGREMTHLEGIKQCKLMVVCTDLPLKGALVWGYYHNDPCGDQFLVDPSVHICWNVGDSIKKPGKTRGRDTDDHPWGERIGNLESPKRSWSRKWLDDWTVDGLKSG